MPYKIFCDESNYMLHDTSDIMVNGALKIDEASLLQAKKHIKYLRHKYNYRTEIKWTKLIAKLYKELIDYFFENIDPQSHKKEDGKECSFWHLTTRTQKRSKKEGNRIITVKERLLDFDRAKRIHWIKPIIDNASIAKNIKLFYKKETTRKKPIRLYLWVEDEDFVVILQKLGKSSSFLVTSFYITHQRKRDDFQKYYEDYIGKTNADLRGCEWF